MSKLRDVPCNGCRLCCYGEAIVLHPEDGDRVADYKTDLIPHPLQPWRRVHIIQQRKEADGRKACIYLGETGCTIWDRRPAICRGFDCRLLPRRISQARLREAIAAGKVDQAVLDRGRELIRQACGKIQGARHAS